MYMSLFHVFVKVFTTFSVGTYVHICVCVRACARKREREICAHKNMNSKMTVTFSHNRTGSFALHFFIGLFTQVSIIIVFLGVLPFSLPVI
jgi:hypothetical protein